jgi:VCBS repeat-containing protein
VGAAAQIENINFGWDFLALPDPVPPTAVPPIQPTPPDTCEDAASFVKDVTVPDGTRFDGGESFSKTWRLQNSGTCTWATDYDLFHISGYSLGGPGVVPFQGEVLPGRTVDITVDLKAPTSHGTYKGIWMLRNADGNLFGIGEDANSPIWVSIIVGPEPEPEITAWRGEYFDNQKLEGDPVLIRNDNEIDFDWKRGAPADELPEDYFSTRWTRTLKFDRSLYRFHLTMDDGASLWIDDRLVIDEWRPLSGREVTIDINLTEGEHDIRLEYFERTGIAHVELWWEKIKLSATSGWRATYWFNRTLDSSFAIVKFVELIDFDWGAGYPALGISSDLFSARWRRKASFEPGRYRLFTRADDGVRVFVDDLLVMDEWHDSGGDLLYTADVILDGSHVIRVEYYERRGDAKIEFWWELIELQNDPPVSKNDSYTLVADQTLTVPAPGVLGNDSDPDADPLQALLTKGTTRGTLLLNDDGSFTYTPDPGFTGEDVFRYRATDGQLKSKASKVTITVHPSNSPPIANDDTYDVDEDTVLSIGAPGLLQNDHDPDGDPLSVSLMKGPENGTLTLNSDGSFTYTPLPDFNGQDNFSYRANDGIHESSPAAVTLVVTPVNDVPVAADDSASMEKSSTIDINVLLNDTGLGDDPITISIADPPAEGTAIVIGNLIRYTPFGGVGGTDHLRYAVTDADGESAQAIISILLTFNRP